MYSNVGVQAVYGVTGVLGVLGCWEYSGYWEYSGTGSMGVLGVRTPMSLLGLGWFELQRRSAECDVYGDVGEQGAGNQLG